MLESSPKISICVKPLDHNGSWCGYVAGVDIQTADDAVEYGADFIHVTTRSAIRDPSDCDEVRRAIQSALDDAVAQYEVAESVLDKGENDKAETGA